MKNKLQEDLKHLQQQLQENKREIYDSRSEKAQRDRTYFWIFYYQLIRASLWCWSYIIKPIYLKLYGVSSWGFKRYKNLWSWVVYKRNQYGTLEFSKTRAGILLTTTLVFFYYVALPTVYFAGDVVVYNLTNDKEKIYLSNSQEIDPKNNVHAVKGCYELPCTDANGIYFRIEPSAFNHFWKIINEFTIYYPDTISAGVPSVISDCSVTTYGFRIKFLINNWDIYPKILKLYCTPMKG